MGILSYYTYPTYLLLIIILSCAHVQLHFWTKMILQREFPNAILAEKALSFSGFLG